MADPFVAEIRMFGCNFAPRNWAQCNGQLLPISQNTALFSLLGTYYGGDGKSTFGLPNLQGSAALNVGTSSSGTSYYQGEKAGVASVTLITSEIPAHIHSAKGNEGDGQLGTPQGNTWAAPGADRGLDWYNDLTGVQTTVAMSPQALSLTGGGQAHNNMMPYNVVNFCIALQGVFPQRS